MILIFGSIEWEKQNTLSNVGEPHLISWRLEYKKMAAFPTKIRELLLDALTWYFPIFGLELKPWLFQGHEPADLQIGTYTISSPGAQVFRLRLELYFWLSIVSSLLTADLLVLFPVELWIIHPDYHDSHDKMWLGLKDLQELILVLLWPVLNLIRCNLILAQGIGNLLLFQNFCLYFI